MLEVIEKDIEWTTLLFFMFLLFWWVGVEEAGLLDIVADWVVALSHGNLVISICLVLWVSAIMSAFVDNIPFTATMLPIVAYLTQVIPGAESGVLWWALAFGACFGRQRYDDWRQCKRRYSWNIRVGWTLYRFYPFHEAGFPLHADQCRGRKCLVAAGLLAPWKFI